MRFSNSILTCALAALTIALLPAVAIAQTSPTITIATPPTRYLPDGVTEAPAHVAIQAGTQAISYADCTSNVQVHFNLAITGIIDNADYTFQAWAGTQDCTAYTARSSTQSSCWPVGLQGLQSTTNSLTQSNVLTAVVPVRDVVSQMLVPVGSINLSYTGPAPVSVCTSPVSGIASVSVYFMIIPNPPGSNVASSNVPQAFSVKLAGPPPPTGISVGAGENLLNVTWAANTGDPTLQGFGIFIDPPPGQTSAVIPDTGPAADSAYVTCQPLLDGGFTDGGVDEAGDPLAGTQILLDGGCTNNTMPPTSTSSGDGGTCGVSALYDGDGGTVTTTTPTEDEAGDLLEGGGVTTTESVGASGSDFLAYLAATATSATSTQQTVTGLTDGIAYNVSVAAYDTYGNYGPLSVFVPATGSNNGSCGIPAPIDDFWKVCKENGCGGDGSCAMEDVPGSGQGAAIFGVTVLGLLATYIKRRRK